MSEQGDISPYDDDNEYVANDIAQSNLFLYFNINFNLFNAFFIFASILFLL